MARSAPTRSTSSSFPKGSFDPVTDFIPVTLLTKTTCVVSVGSDSAFKTLQELIDYAKANPGKLNYGITNFGDACQSSASKN